MTRENIPYVLFSDEDFLLFYKPPFWKMDTDTNYENISPKKIEKIFNRKIKPFHLYIKFYLMKYYNVIPNNPSYNVCQRFDQETSGGILVSIKNENHKMCREIISNKENTKKIYLTLVNGKIKKKNGYIYNNIKCSKIPSYCTTIPYNKKNKKSMFSSSYYNVISEYKHNDNFFSLVHVRIFTGRTHQVRVHMKSLGYSLVSDDRYTSVKERNENLKICDRMFLHNIFSGFYAKEREYNFIIPIPEDLLICLSKITQTKIFKDIYDIKYLLNLQPEK
jgi:23S rRNA-/tRNA-specific pseudouridylate synthase